MDWAVDVAKYTFLYGKAEAVTDFETKKPQADENGVPLYRVILGLMTDDGDIQRAVVKVAGDPGLTPKTPVTPIGLTVSSWSMQDKDSGRHRSGESLKAERIVPMSAPSGKAAS